MRAMTQRERMAHIATEKINALQGEIDFVRTNNFILQNERNGLGTRCSELTYEVELLRDALYGILNGATRTVHHDSGGWAQVYVRQVMLNKARRLLGRSEEEELGRPY